MSRSQGVYVVAALAGALVLAGCSASPTSSSTTTPGAAASAPAAVSPSPTPTVEAPTLESVAAKIGLAGFTRSTEAAPLTLGWGQGTLNGSVVKLYQFGDDAAWQSFLQSVAGFGLTDANFVKTGQIAIAPNDQSQLDSIRAAAG